MLGPQILLIDESLYQPVLTSWSQHLPQQVPVGPQSQEISATRCKMVWLGDYMCWME